MAAKEKVVGFKVTEESNLHERMKMLRRRTGQEYGTLLEKWVCREESDLGPLLFEQPQPVSVPQAENIDARIGTMEKTIADLTTRLETSEEIASLKLQVAELTTKLEATLQALKPRDADDLATVELHETEVEGDAAGQVEEVETIIMPPVPAETAEVRFDNVTQSDPVDCITNPSVPDMTAVQVVEEKPVAVSSEEIKRYILALGKTGMTVKEIAKYLNAKGVPTKSGVGQWRSTSVIPILKQAQMELEKGPVTEVKDGEEAETKVREVEDVKREADFFPDPSRRRGRSKKAKAETETLPEDTKDSNPSPSVADK